MPWHKIHIFMFASFCVFEVTRTFKHLFLLKGILALEIHLIPVESNFANPLLWRKTKIQPHHVQRGIFGCRKCDPETLSTTPHKDVDINHSTECNGSARGKSHKPPASGFSRDISELAIWHPNTPSIYTSLGKCYADSCSIFPALAFRTLTVKSSKLSTYSMAWIHVCGLKQTHWVKLNTSCRSQISSDFNRQVTNTCGLKENYYCSLFNLSTVIAYFHISILGLH